MPALATTRGIHRNRCRAGHFHKTKPTTALVSKGQVGCSSRSHRNRSRGLYPPWAARFSVGLLSRELLRRTWVSPRAAPFDLAMEWVRLWVDRRVVHPLG